MSNIERCGFFASINNDRLYDDDEFASYFGRFLQDGVFPLPESGLFVEADGSNILTVNPGSAWIQGRHYELLEKKQLQIEAGDALLSRIDMVVVRCDYVNREIYTTIKKGIESSEPKLPELQRDSDAYELGIAYYRVDKGVTNLVQSNIIDTRKSIDLCGEVTSIIDKHSLKEFLKDTGFTMRGDMNTKNIAPIDTNCNIGTPEMRYKKIYAQGLDLVTPLPYLPIEGGTMDGDLYVKGLYPYKSNYTNLGSSTHRYANAHFTNLYVYGEHPFLNKSGGTATGYIDHNFTPNSRGYYEKYYNFDGNTQGDGNTYIGYNLDGLCTHMFRGKGNFNVENPVATFNDLRADSLMINNKRVYIQSEPPVNAPEGSVWIKV